MTDRPRVVLSQLNLVASDMPAAVAFYRRLGLEIPERYAIVADPDRNHVGLMSPIDEAKRSAPPALG